ncbi:MAG: DUF3990 domain-containing protein [Coriobacteriales bacterium]|nr:DUF3990 domain-containing protein [Coriobacteriales bacterium]
MEYHIQEDMTLIQELLGMSRAALARAAGVSVPTIDRWAVGRSHPRQQGLESLYAYAWRRRLRLNRYKEQFLVEDTPPGHVPLFHGAKSALDGPPRCDRSRDNNDLGSGFYCGETLEQAAMFVSGFPGSCVYSLTLDTSGLRCLTLGVDLEWMLLVSLCRGRLDDYRNTPSARDLLSRLEAADYVVAPIADNRMFQVIDEFADGNITDIQCVHALSATDLGLQYVMRTERATAAVTLRERLFLCAAERDAYAALGRERSRTGVDKARVARRQHRGLGRYVDEVFDETR